MSLLVADASALVEFLLRTPLGQSLDTYFAFPDADLHVPALCDIDLVSALRGGLRRDLFTSSRAQDALRDYLDLPLTRHGHQALLHRCLQFRDRLSAYDASYVALAQRLKADLVTADRRLARTAESLGVSCLPA